MFRFLRPPVDATIPFLVLVSFLIWFVISRLFVYNFPQIFISINDIHVHHYAYGVILLSILAFVFLAYPMNHRARIRFAIPLGIALAWAYDEYAMWFTFDASYSSKLTIDAIIVITIILLNLTYLSNFWARWGHKLNKLINIIFLGLPVFIYRTTRRLLSSK